MDQLAAEGLVLERFYVHKWCAPTRSSLMTGRNPMHTGLDPMNWTSTIMRGEGCDPPQSLRGCDSSLSADYVFLPRLLRSAGYESAMLGKVRDGHTPLRRFVAVDFGTQGYRINSVCLNQPPQSGLRCCEIQPSCGLPDAEPPLYFMRSGTSGRSYKISHQSGVDSQNHSASSEATKPMTRICSGMDDGTSPGRRAAR